MQEKITENISSFYILSENYFRAISVVTLTTWLTIFIEKQPSWVLLLSSVFVWKPFKSPLQLKSKPKKFNDSIFLR